MDSRWWTGGVRRWQGAWFDPSGPHVGQELVRDFGEHFLGQASHAEDVVTSSINIVSERNKLQRGEERRVEKEETREDNKVSRRGENRNRLEERIK